MAQSKCLTAALRYASWGWAVFPLCGKRPYPGSHGHREATTDPTIIRRWWKKWPQANVGIACSSVNGPLVVDIDGPDGMTTYQALGLEDSRSATSGRPGRQHVYFGPMRNGTRIKRMIKVRPELDILGDGGYVVAPPSIHPVTGRPYTWVSRLPLVPFPKELFKLTGSRRHAVAPPLPEILDEGRRDELLTSLAGSMRRRGAGYEAILAALQVENGERCQPPLGNRQLEKIAKSIAAKPPAGSGENPTDLGNARRFIEQHGEDLRAVGGRRRPWLIWEGNRWALDESCEVERKAKDTIRSIRREADAENDEELKSVLMKHATKSEQSARISSMLELAATEPEVAMTLDQFDTNPWLLNVENMKIDLKTGQALAHDRLDLCTKISPVEYQARARAPRWQTFLKEIMDGDNDLVDFLQRTVGYALTGDTREQCLFFAYGHGSNGKSTFLEILRELLGGYAQQADFTTFLERRGEGPRNDLARMRGARLVTAAEASGNRSFDETVLKQLTGGDTIVARRLYEEHFEFRPQHKIILAANHKPVVHEQTEAFWRRIRLIPFTVTFSRAKRDNTLGHTLRAELPGILNWAIEGCLKWQAEGLHVPKAVAHATNSYRDENDLLGEFLDQRCQPDDSAWTPTSELYRIFEEWWLDTRGARNKPFSMSWFARALAERSTLAGSKRNGIRGWRGITLRHEVTT